MLDHRAAYIAACKKPKSEKKARRLLGYIIAGLHKSDSVERIAERLNELKVYSLMGKRHNYHSLQMQLLAIARDDETNTLARTFKAMLEDGEVTIKDLELIQSRTRH